MAPTDNGTAAGGDHKYGTPVGPYLRVEALALEEHGGGNSGDGGATGKAGCT